MNAYSVTFPAPASLYAAWQKASPSSATAVHLCAECAAQWQTEGWTLLPLYPIALPDPFDKAPLCYLCGLDGAKDPDMAQLFGSKSGQIRPTSERRTA